MALLQADFDRRTFLTEREEAVSLTAGATRKVYLTPSASRSLNFDHYPTDVKCEMTSPTGGRIEGKLEDERRPVDGWRMHWGATSFTVPTTGTFTLLCEDMSNRSYPLVLAAPSRIGPYDVAPSFGLILLILSLVPLGIAVLAGRIRDNPGASRSDS